MDDVAEGEEQCREAQTDKQAVAGAQLVRRPVHRVEREGGDKQANAQRLPKVELGTRSENLGYEPVPEEHDDHAHDEKSGHEHHDIGHDVLEREDELLLGSLRLCCCGHEAS